MGALCRRAAIAVACIIMFAASARAEDSDIAPLRRDATIFEASTRLRLGWTEMAFAGSHPKAWDDIMSPEFRASLRVLDGMFEGKFEIDTYADRFDEHGQLSTDNLRSELQLGINTGPWSYLFEWKARNGFHEGTDDFVVGLDTYDLRLRNRFALTVFGDLAPARVQASLAGGYVAAMPHIFAREFAELELEMVQPLVHGFTFTVTPKLELSDYLAFPGGKREDAVFSLKLIPTYNFGGGIALSVEGQATVAFSTRDIKTGEIWAVTPILRLQKAM